MKRVIFSLKTDGLDLAKLAEQANFMERFETFKAALNKEGYVIGYRGEVSKIDAPPVIIVAGKGDKNEEKMVEDFEALREAHIPMLLYERMTEAQFGDFERRNR